MSEEALAKRLVDLGVVEAATMERIRQRQRGFGGSLDRHLVELGALSFEELLMHHAAVVGAPPLRVAELDRMVRDEVMSLIPRSFALRYKVVPIRRLGLQVVAVVAAPLEAGVAERFAVTYGLSLRPVAAPEFVVSGLLSWLFGCSGEPASARLIARLLPRFSLPKEHEGAGRPVPSPRPAAEYTRLLTLSGLRAALVAAESPVVMVEVVRGFLRSCCGQSAVWRVRPDGLEPWDAAQDTPFEGAWFGNEEQSASALGAGALACAVTVQGRAVLVLGAGPPEGVITPRQRGQLIGATDALSRALSGAWMDSTR
jgi:hypothetical protein